MADGANFRSGNYHCLDGADDVDTIDWTFLTQVTQATLGAAAEMLGVQ